MANFCSQCGYALPRVMHICPQCGAMLADGAGGATATAAPSPGATYGPAAGGAPGGYHPGAGPMTWSGPRYGKAPLGARLGASLLDGLITMAAWVPGLVLIGIGGAGEVEAITTAGGLLVVIGIVWALYYSFVKDGWRTGASLGKRAVGLMVVHLPTNQPCTKGQSALRALVLLLLNFVPLIGWLIEPIVVLTAVDGRRLGDRAADTQVVTVAEYAAHG